MLSIFTGGLKGEEPLGDTKSTPGEAGREDTEVAFDSNPSHSFFDSVLPLFSDWHSTTEATTCGREKNALLLLPFVVASVVLIDNLAKALLP